MSSPHARTVLLALFALVGGHYAYRLLTPAPASEYAVRVAAEPMTLPTDLGGGGKSFYLRQNINLTQPPHHAWVRAIGHDVLSFYVNGARMAQEGSLSHSSDNVILGDLTPLLHRGDNCIAMVVYQRSVDSPPAVAIEGELEFADGRTQPIPDDWRCSDHFERQDGYWYETGFDASAWAVPQRAKKQNLKGVVRIPPAAITSAPRGEWIAPPTAENGQGAVRASFEVDGVPDTTWLRAISSASCSIALNGQVVVSDHDSVGSSPPLRRVTHVVDVGPYVKAGRNTLAVMMTSPCEMPYVACDLQATTQGGAVTRVKSDASWRGAAGAPKNWLAADEPATGWAAVRADRGRPGIRELRAPRQYVAAEELPPASVTNQLSSVLSYALAILAAGLLSWLAVVGVSRLVDSDAHPDASIALAPLIALGLMGMLAVEDPGIVFADVYDWRWAAAATAYLAAAWTLLVLASRAALRGMIAERLRGGVARGASAWAPWLALALVFAAGLFVRLENILTEPMHHDEVGAYFFTMSTLEQGFPGGQVHPNMPFGYAATSELVYFFNAPFGLLFEDPLLVIRVPAVIWSMLTLLLLYHVGDRLFGRSVGLAAAALYAASPYLVGMSNFGRYFSQLQFFGLLTCYAYYRTIEGTGPINRRALWVTAISFICTFLSWEASAFMGVGMLFAGLVYRRGHVKHLLLSPHPYAGSAAILLVVLVQNAHRTEQQIQRLWYGSGISDVSIEQMWRFPEFDPTFYIQQTSWTADSLLPFVGLCGGAAMALVHRRRDPVQVMLMIVLFTSVAMAAVLPLRATRYVYHLVPITILLSAAALDAAGAWLAGAALRGRAAWSVAYCRLQTGLAIAAVLFMASGMWAQTQQLEAYANAAYRPGLLKFPHWEEPMRYVRSHMHDRDVVISLYPHLTDMTMRLAKEHPVDDDWTSDYWLQSVLVLQATLSDSTPQARDRRAGTPMIYDRESLEKLFQTHGRVWYLTIRSAHDHINQGDVSALVRQNMDVVYEDAQTMVFLRDSENRPADLRHSVDEQVEEAKAQVLR